MPISDNIQGIIMFASALFIAIGAVTVPSTLPNHDSIGFALMIIGAIGMFLKEKAGALIPSSSNNVPQPSPIPQPPPTNPTDVSNFTPDS